MNTDRTITRLAALVLALVLPFALAACGDDDGAAATTTTATKTLEATDVWAGPATAGGNGAVYMTITGDGTADALTAVGVPTDVATSVDLHETTTDTSSDMTTTMAPDDSPTTAMEGGEMGDGMMTMKQVERIDVPADGTAVLEPGGYHVMLLDLQKDLVVGDTIPVTLTFERAGKVDVTAAVRER